jgi:hypothetical protein
MSMNRNIIESLRSIAKVPVYLGEREAMSGQSILISQVKMSEVVAMYKGLYEFTHKAWRNLPPPPDCEAVFVIIWMLTSENYDINHFTIEWKGSTANTFVHLWSIIERLKTILQPMDLTWLVAARDPLGYSKTMKMTGAADKYLYPIDPIVPPHIDVFVNNMPKMKTEVLENSYSSNFNFMMSLTKRTKKKVMDVNTMAMMNMKAMTRSTERG